MSLGKKHVLGFSPNGGQLFASVDELGVLRIWNTETNTLKQEFTPNLQVSGPCTALTWVSLSAPRPKKSRKSLQSQEATDNKLYIALGTLKGVVVIYSLAEGKIERTLSGDNHDGAVTSIAYDNADHLYTVGVDCRALVWSLSEGRCLGDWQVGPEKPQNIAYLPKSRTLAVGSRQLKVFDVKTKELVETFTGHSGEINTISQVVCADSSEFVLTTAKMERVICFWKVEKRGKSKASACTLLMEDLAYCLTSEVREDGQLRVASVTRNGNIHIYLLNVNSLSAEKFVKPKVSLQIVSDGAETVEPILAVAAHFVTDSNRSHEILFGYGSRQQLQFERFTPNYAEKLNVIVRADPKKLYAKKKGKEQIGFQEATKVQKPIVSQKNVEYNSALPISQKKVQNDVPMEARLQHLQIQSTKLSGGKLQTQSKTQLLMQALHSKDQAMIKAVLSTNDVETIQLTLDRLPLEYVSPLVNELSILLQGKHTSVGSGLRWLKVLASTHTSVLMSEDKEALREKLAVCLGVAEQRMHCLSEALQISGRVNLIISQMKRNADNHLNDSKALIVDDEPDDLEETLEDDNLLSENNWSDLEEQQVSPASVSEQDVEADDDLATDDGNPDTDDSDESMAEEE
ncbi:WD repeat-containing protein 43 isoform X2 [Drosophila bipectinata]|uniref:WD repeat-containing protein 43 isoform X2 n=1 Tax=Drosophila bipectinata TaxID=42026 RepID=UPI001C8A9209|nr:WD repeat-containing protein 43 isoform X2 [Drosophila bipectinata]